MYRLSPAPMRFSLHGDQEIAQPATLPRGCSIGTEEVSLLGVGSLAQDEEFSLFSAR